MDSDTQYCWTTSFWPQELTCVTTTKVPEQAHVPVEPGAPSTLVYTVTTGAGNSASLVAQGLMPVYSTLMSLVIGLTAVGQFGAGFPGDSAKLIADSAVKASKIAMIVFSFYFDLLVT